MLARVLELMLKLEAFNASVFCVVCTILTLYCISGGGLWHPEAAPIAALR